MSAPADAPEPTCVAIGLIGRAGRYLIRRRPPLPGSPMPGYWEFPGGKCHEGESPADTVRRECQEEVGLPIVVTALRQVRRHLYPHGFVELHFFDCESADRTAEPDPATGFVWVPAAELPHYTFPGGNDPIVAELAAQARMTAPSLGERGASAPCLRPKPQGSESRTGG